MLKGGGGLKEVMGWTGGWGDATPAELIHSVG